MGQAVTSEPHPLSLAAFGEGRLSADARGDLGFHAESCPRIRAPGTVGHLFGVPVGHSGVTMYLSFVYTLACEQLAHQHPRHMQGLPHPSSAPIVVVDDDENDVFLLRRLLARSGVANRLICFSDSEAAIAHIRRSEEVNGTAGVPLLAMIDVKMPGYDGFGVLAALRKAPLFARTAAVMMSSSGAERDVDQARALGAQCYFVKFPTADAIRQMITEALRFHGLGAATILEIAENLLWNPRGSKQTPAGAA